MNIAHRDRVAPRARWGIAIMGLAGIAGDVAFIAIGSPWWTSDTHRAEAPGILLLAITAAASIPALLLLVWAGIRAATGIARAAVVLATVPLVTFVPLVAAVVISGDRSAVDLWLLQGFFAVLALVVVVGTFGLTVFGRRRLVTRSER